MKSRFIHAGLILLISFGGWVSAAFTPEKTPPLKNINFPYQEAGLTKRQAAAHLLGRFTFGARPGQLDELVKMGPEQWFWQQLKADLPDNTLQPLLEKYSTLKMTNAQMVQTFPRNNQVLALAIKEGVISPDIRDRKAQDNATRQQYQQQLAAYMAQKGFKPPAELYRELISQKILRAAYSENQLQEMLTSFWFNHFNVSLTDNDCSPYITSYERDVIRPHALGPFQNILIATAKSPAMLTYLDNFKSTGATKTRSAMPLTNQNQALPLMPGSMPDTAGMAKSSAAKIKKIRNAAGLNENYAREVMELHTLGVDGGYTQTDVTQAARVLTGWTIRPVARLGQDQMGGRQANLRTVNNLNKKGFVLEEDFLFAANKHDKNEKIVLGTKFPANGGYEEGVQLLQMLAQHPATARFISTKLATRFVSDNPPQSLIDKMAQIFTEQNGDISQVLITMVSAPEFWRPEALREKTKSPFELAISSVRSLNATVQAPFALNSWITKMGEKMYYYQAPTGFPDQGKYWINTGSLLYRMNFGLALAAGQIPGITLNLPALNQNREPESAEAALAIYSKLLMPERNLEATIKRLSPALNDPHFGQKVKAATEKITPINDNNSVAPDEQIAMAVMGTEKKVKEKSSSKKVGQKNSVAGQMPLAIGQNAMLAQVVGIILGSPEFQRR